jgi:hypothetical protein
MAWKTGAPRTLTDKQQAAWMTRIDRAAQMAKQFHPVWERALKRYTDAKFDQDRYDVNSLMDFRHVESKRAQLFYQTPEVQLVPTDPDHPEIPFEQLLPLRQKVLNHRLGANGTNAKRAVHETLFDAIATSGFMILKVGYENRVVNVTTMQQEMVDNEVVELEVEVPVPVWERCFLSRVSPKRLLIPIEFHGGDFDSAAWLGVKGRMPLTQAKQQPGWTLPDMFEGGASKDETTFDHGTTDQGETDPMVEYTEVWYRASLFDTSVVHPDLFRCLILVEGVDRPVKHIDSPYQSLDDMGRLTDDSMLGNPIHVGTLRDLSDSAYVPSDLVVGEQLVNELNKFRTQQVRGRARRQPMVVFDTSNLDQETIRKLENNQGPVGLPAGSLAAGADKLIAVIGTGSEPRDNYTAQDYIERDWERALGVSANQQGGYTKSKRTATEARIVQGNADARVEAERDRVREWYIAAVRKFDAILQRVMSPVELTKILGQQGGALWTQWRMLPGRYVYRIQPDSGVHVDAMQHRQQVLDEYNLLRRDERVNVDELLKKVAVALHHDPAQFIAPPQERPPEPIKLSLAFNGEHLLLPGAGRLLLDLLTESGVKLGPDTIQRLAAIHAHQAQVQGMPPPAPPPQAPTGLAGMIPGSDMMPVAPSAVGHEGSALVTEPVNQHQTQRTGGVQGVGV